METFFDNLSRASHVGMPLVVSGIIPGLLLTGLVTLLLRCSTRANAATTGSTFEREVKPEIENYITSHGISHEEFNTKAAEVLPGNSPLLSYLAD